MIVVAVGEDAEVRIGDAALQLAQLGLAVLEDLRILHRDEPVVDALGHGLLRHRVVHEPARDVDLAHRAARPGDHLGREHGANAELLADGDEQRVDAGGVGGGELGDVADAHQHLGVGIAPARLGVALERGHEAEADRLDDRDR